jgi:hypothetical protein
MEKELSKQILSSITGIVDQSDGYQVSYEVNTHTEVSHFPRVVTERTSISIILVKKV